MRGLLGLILGVNALCGELEDLELGGEVAVEGADGGVAAHDLGGLGAVGLVELDCERMDGAHEAGELFAGDLDLGFLPAELGLELLDGLHKVAYGLLVEVLGPHGLEVLGDADLLVTHDAAVEDVLARYQAQLDCLAGGDTASQ